MISNVLTSSVRPLRFQGGTEDSKTEPQGPQCKDGVCTLPAQDKPAEEKKAPEAKMPEFKIPFYMKPFAWFAAKIMAKLTLLNAPLTLKQYFGYDISDTRDKSLVKTLTPKTFEAEVLKSNQPVLVDFWAPWCTPCKMFTPALEQTANDYKGKIRFFKLNVQSYPKLKAEYGVEGIPALILFKDGKEVQRMTGIPQKTVLVEALDKTL